MAIQGLQLLPPSVKVEEALSIYKKLSEVSNKISRLDERFNGSMVGDNLISILAQQESVQSTRIEGTQVTFTDIMEEQDDPHPRWEVIEVLNYQKALMEGIDYIRNGYPITTRMIQKLHSTLMEGGRGTKEASGQFRKIQNFIGPTNRIEDASYIPIPANEIDQYMQNWETYMNQHPYGKEMQTDHLPPEDEVLNEQSNPLLKTAIVHAQFESIHPFLDGNGRLGRILIVLYLLQSKIIAKPIFFVSEELERERARYYDMLNGVRGDKPDWLSWLLFFLKACDRMAEKLLLKLERAESLAISGLEKCGKDSEKKVWMYTFFNPNCSAAGAAKFTRLNPNTARSALNTLAEKGLLYTNPNEKRNRKYKNYDLLEVLR
ncbi:Fic/DOC family protein [Sporosarcina sp. P37]|uniref:Fic family protein n=1 Tax=unclassified Sporosarcina TaxID=2647733 RepID=UPI000A17B7AE|nr:MULTISPECIES: Fic family protein [unclassified Sporosarcina]ARK25344.1 Fic/DOC family protein [Sporosarcina sp. P37]PID17141.1 Fic family protein [Sporosarcina sp. P35]